jgi:hypothetical protein
MAAPPAGIKPQFGRFGTLFAPHGGDAISADAALVPRDEFF